MNTHIKTWLGTIIIIIMAITAGIFVWKVYEMNNISVSMPQAIQTTKQRADEDFHSQPIDPFAVYCVQHKGALYFKNNTRYCKFTNKSECEEKAYMNGICSDANPVEVNGILYMNNEYGFELILPKGWEGYKTSTMFGPGQATQISFELPTNHDAWLKNSGGKKTASVFDVTIYPISSNLKNEAPNRKEISRNEKYIIYYDRMDLITDYPIDFTPELFNQVDEIIKTFKFLN